MCACRSRGWRECVVETQRDLAESALVAPIVGHVGDGNFHLTILVDMADPGEVARARALHERLIARAQAMDGTCTGEHGVGQGKMKYLAGRAWRAGARGDGGAQARARSARHHESGQDRSPRRNETDIDLPPRVATRDSRSGRGVERSRAGLFVAASPLPQTCRSVGARVPWAPLATPDAREFGAPGGDGVQNTLLGFAIAIILALVTALVAPLFIDWGRYRGEFEATASRLTGLQVKIAGPIDARLLPSPTLTLQRVEVSRPGQSGQTGTVKAQTLGIEFALASLVRGEWRATDVHVERRRVGARARPRRPARLADAVGHPGSRQRRHRTHRSARQPRGAERCRQRLAPRARAVRLQGRAAFAARPGEGRGLLCRRRPALSLSGVGKPPRRRRRGQAALCNRPDRPSAHCRARCVARHRQRRAALRGQPAVRPPGRARARGRAGADRRALAHHQQGERRRRCGGAGTSGIPVWAGRARHQAARRRQGQLRRHARARRRALLNSRRCGPPAGAARRDAPPPAGRDQEPRRLPDRQPDLSHPGQARHHGGKPDARRRHLAARQRRRAQRTGRLGYRKPRNARARQHPRAVERRAHPRRQGRQLRGARRASRRATRARCWPGSPTAPRRRPCPARCARKATSSSAAT